MNKLKNNFLYFLQYFLFFIVAYWTLGILMQVSRPSGVIGIVLENNEINKKVYVSEVKKDSPADKVGIKVGDYILGIDGNSITNRNKDYVANKIRGKAYTYTTLKVVRNDKELSFKIRREKAKINEKPFSW